MNEKCVVPLSEHPGFTAWFMLEFKTQDTVTITRGLHDETLYKLYIIHKRGWKLKFLHKKNRGKATFFLF